MSLLLLVPFVYAVICIFDVQRAAFAVSVASRSAARAYLMAVSSELADADAYRAARVALADQAVDADVHLRCLPADMCRQPGSKVRVVVRATVALPLTPSALGEQFGGIVVDASHVESFGAFRAADE